MNQDKSLSTQEAKWPETEVASHPVSTEDLGPKLPKCHLALSAPLGKGGQHVATGPLSQEVGIAHTHTLLVSPDSLVLVLGREGGVLSVSQMQASCLSVSLSLCVAFSICPSLTVGGEGMRGGSGANKLCLDSS